MNKLSKIFKPEQLNKLFTKFKNQLKKFSRFIKRWNEILSIPAAFFIWWVSPFFLRMVDSTAGVSDIGIFQFLISATVAILFGHALIWLILKLVWPEIYEILDDCVTKETKLTPWQKILFSLSYWGLLLVSWSILVAGMS